MKKFLIILGVAVLAASCIGPQGPQGIPGRDGDSAPTFILHYTVYGGDWRKQYDDNGNFLFWYNDIPIPELSRNIFENGYFLAYVRSGDVQELIQTIIYNETDGQLWEGKYACEFYVGGATVMYQENDFANENYDPGTVEFRIVLVGER